MFADAFHQQSVGKHAVVGVFAVVFQGEMVHIKRPHGFVGDGAIIDARGQSVVVVGDENIAPHFLDVVSAGLGDFFYENRVTTCKD